MLMDINGDTKTLLIKDLSARVPYKIKCAYFDGMGNERVDILNAIFPNDERVLIGKCSVDYSESDILGVIPYLFPLSSMTEEQAKEMQEIVGSPKDAYIARKTDGLQLWLDPVDTDPTIWLDVLFELQDWLNKNHFDYRGLIPKGAAKDATRLNIY